MSKGQRQLRRSLVGEARYPAVVFVELHHWYEARKLDLAGETGLSWQFLQVILVAGYLCLEHKTSTLWILLHNIWDAKLVASNKKHISHHWSACRLTWRCSSRYSTCERHSTLQHLASRRQFTLTLNNWFPLPSPHLAESELILKEKENKYW